LRLQFLLDNPRNPIVPFMAAFTELVRRLLQEGGVRLREPPRLAAEEREDVLALLASAYADHCLDVAGPAIAFSPDCALRAVEFLAWSCWFLLHRGEPAEAVDRALPRLPSPRSAAEHLNADLVYRFLPQVHRRARAADPQDRLTQRLEDALRRWPLSGVLADLDDPPLVDVELDGHPGLQLLYAERLADHSRVAWVVEGGLHDCIEWVFAQRGLPLPQPTRSLT
jgi:hypothetical protein